MKYTTSLKLSLKYHILALLPLVAGLAIAVVGIWIGIIDPVIIALDGVDPQALLSGGLLHNADINPLLGSTSALAGYFVHRVGRTALLMRIHGTAVESRTQDMIEDAQAKQPSHRTAATAPLNPDPDQDTREEGTEGEGEKTGQGHAESVEGDEEQEVLDPVDMIESIKDDLEMDEDTDEDSTDGEETDTRQDQ